MEYKKDKNSFLTCSYSLLLFLKHFLFSNFYFVRIYCIPWPIAWSRKRAVELPFAIDMEGEGRDEGIGETWDRGAGEGDVGQGRVGKCGT